MTLPDIAERESRDIQFRSFALDDYELREDADAGTITFEGTASVVDHPYTVRDMWGEYTETIARGAFDKTIKNGSAAFSLYVNHRKMDVPLATRGAGTLTMSADPNLRVSANLDPARPDVQIIASALRRGEMGEMSIGFRPVRDTWNKDRSEVQRVEVNVREASIVEQGMNTGGTTAKLRAFDDFLSTLTECEMSEDEVRRAIDYFTRLLPEQLTPADERGETLEDEVEALAEALRIQAQHDADRLLLLKFAAV